MKKILYLLVITGLSLTSLYAQTAGHPAGHQKPKRQVAVGASNMVVSDSSDHPGTANSAHINIGPENQASFTGEYELNGAKYSYSVTPATGNARYNVIIKSFIQEEDFGNWKQIYSGIITIEDLQTSRKLYKIKLYHFTHSGYTWTPSPGAFLEANFNLKVRKVAYRTVAAMKTAMGNPKDTIVSLENEDLNTSRMMDYLMRYFTEHYREYEH